LRYNGWFFSYVFFNPTQHFKLFGLGIVCHFLHHRRVSKQKHHLYLKLAKTPCFSFLSFIFFSSTKSENKRVEQVLPGRGGGVGMEWGISG
jgi:hypothetical protein